LSGTPTFVGFGDDQLGWSYWYHSWIINLADNIDCSERFSRTSIPVLKEVPDYIPTNGFIRFSRPILAEGGNVAIVNVTYVFGNVGAYTHLTVWKRQERQWQLKKAMLISMW
jgi:hypothetical protein